MQHFRTTLSIPNFDFDINHQNHVFCIGSCFAENIAQKLQNSKFNTQLNPFGILYNPFSIAKSLYLLLEGKQFKENQLFENQVLWHSFDHHGQFSKPDKIATLNGINEELLKSQTFLKQTNRLIVTMGTANVFVLKKNGKIVANCHKLPGNEFVRKRLSVKTIVEKLSAAFEKLKTQHPDLQIIVTVSPIRHIRDGLIENQKSKAILLLALDEICNSLDFVHYFPSYEILLDDLRDYRFYKSDLIHPNDLAVDYIWDVFKQSFFSEETIELNAKIEKIIAASNHRPFHEASDNHQTFLKQQLKIIENLIEEYPFLDFDPEINLFKSQLIR